MPIEKSAAPTYTHLEGFNGSFSGLPSLCCSAFDSSVDTMTPKTLWPMAFSAPQAPPIW